MTDIFVVELAANGDVNSIHVYGALGADSVMSITPRSSGGYYLCGKAEAFATPSEDDMLIFAIDSSYALLWARRIGITGK